MVEFPKNTQELFEFSILKARTVVSEYGGFEDYLKLLARAEWYANKNNLKLPSLENFGIYREIEESECDVLRSERARWVNK